MRKRTETHHSAIIGSRRATLIRSRRAGTYWQIGSRRARSQFSARGFIRARVVWKPPVPWNTKENYNNMNNYANMKHAKCSKLFKPISSINRIALLRFFLWFDLDLWFDFGLNMFVNKLMWIWVILRYFSCLYDELIYHLGSVGRASVFNSFITVYRGLRFENPIHALGIWSPRRSDRRCRTSSEKSCSCSDVRSDRRGMACNSSKPPRFRHATGDWWYNQ